MWEIEVSLKSAMSCHFILPISNNLQVTCDLHVINRAIACRYQQQKYRVSAEEHGTA